MGKKVTGLQTALMRQNKSSSLEEAAASNVEKMATNHLIALIKMLLSKKEVTAALKWTQTWRTK